MFAELHGGHADAARRAVDQKDFAAFQPGPMDQRMEGGGGTDPERRALGEGPALGQAHLDAGCRHAYILSHGAWTDPEDHLVASLPALHLGADRRDRAGAFHAWNERQFRLVLVASAQHQNVGEIHGGGADLDQHVGRPGLRDRPLLDFQDGRIAQTVANDGAHEGRLHPASRARRRSCSRASAPDPGLPCGAGSCRQPAPRSHCP